MDSGQSVSSSRFSVSSSGSVGSSKSGGGGGGGGGAFISPAKLKSRFERLKWTSFGKGESKKGRPAVLKEVMLENIFGNIFRKHIHDTMGNKWYG